MKRTALIALTTALAMLSPTTVALADPSPVTGVELNVPEDQFVGTAVRYDPAAGRTVGLPALKQLRKEMWKINPPLEYSTLREVAAGYGITTLEQYLDVDVDASLNASAVQRAFEASTVRQHMRPDGSLIWTATPANGTKFFAESLAWGDTDLAQTISRQWGHGELRALRAANGEPNAKNGHLVMMIHPKYRTYGFGLVEVSGSQLAGASAATGTSRPVAHPDTTEPGKQVTWMYRAPREGEKPTGLRTEEPKFYSGVLGGGADTSGGGVLGLLMAIVSLLGVLAGIAQFFMPRQ